MVHRFYDVQQAMSSGFGAVKVKSLTSIKRKPLPVIPIFYCSNSETNMKRTYNLPSFAASAPTVSAHVWQPAVAALF
jgi:hypothetical protein